LTEASLAAGERLNPCPDCGKMISRRAQQCPQCGCPIAERLEAGPARPGGISSAAVGSLSQSAEEAFEPSRRLLLAAAGGAVALCIVAALVFVVVKAMSPSPPSSLPVAAESAPPAAKVTAEQKAAWIKEVATARASDVDNLYGRLHSTKLLLESVKQTADLLKTMAGPDGLSKLPTDAAPASAQTKPYQSQLDALFKECSQYLRGNLPSGDYSRDDVLAAADRWVKGKEAPILAELEKFANQQTLLQGLDPSAAPSGAQPGAQPAAPSAAPAGSKQ
jgi:hypothetical protein